MTATKPPAKEEVEKPEAVGDNVAQSMTKILVGNVGMMGLSVFTGVITARTLLVSGRGEVAAVLSLVLYISLAGSLGNWTGLGRVEAQEPEKSDQVVGAAMIAVAILGTATVLLAELLLPLLFTKQSAELLSAARWLVLIIYPVMMFQCTNELLVGRQRFGRVSFDRFVRPLYHAIGILVLWAMDEVTVTNVVLATGLSYFLVGFVSFGSLISESGIARPDRDVVNKSFHFGIRIFGGIISQKSNHELDLMIMPALVGPEIIGVYVVAVSAAAIVSGGFSHLRQLVFGIVSRGESGDNIEIIEFTGRLTLLGASMAAAGLFVLAPVLIEVVYGSEFAGAVRVLRVLLPGVVVLVFSEVLFGALASLDKPLWATYSSLVGLVVTVTGIALTVKPYGAMGAAATTTVAYTVMMFATLWYASNLGVKVSRIFSFKLLRADLTGLLATLNRWRATRGAQVT